MAFDDAATVSGDFKRYQRKIYIVLGLTSVICAIHKLSNVFLQAKPNHRCRLEKEDINATYDLRSSILNASLPYDEASGAYSSCFILENGEEVPCQQYVFDDSTYKSSIVIEWGIVCNRSYLTAIGDSIFMLGVLLGSVVFGDLSDRWGRRITFFIALTMLVIFGLLMAVAPEFWLYTIFRFVVGSTTSGVFLVAYVIAIEMVGPKDRLIVSIAFEVFFSCGYMLVALFAFFIRDWRYLQTALSLPGVLFFAYWWFIPESVRWLLAKGRIEEAKNIVRKAGKISDEIVHELLCTDTNQNRLKEKSATIFDLFKNPKTRLRFIVVLFDWAVNSMTYYGLSWNTSNLGGNVYVNFVIAGALELLVPIYLLLTLNKWGRKYVLCVCMVTAGVTLLTTMVVPNELTWAIITLAMLGKLTITGSYNILYIFSAEQFPTELRNTGLGVGSMCARIGAILAPFINLTHETWKPLPLITFGLLSLFGGAVTLILPETSNQPLPDTIADLEKMRSTKENMTGEQLHLNPYTHPVE